MPSNGDGEESSAPQQKMILVGRGLTVLPTPALTQHRSTLTKLVLANNAIESSALPVELWDVWGLEHLNLTNNKLTQLPDGIAKLQRLKWLNLSINQLNRLPPSLGNLTELRHLDLTFNLLDNAALPDTFFTLNALRNLYLSDNLLTELSEKFGMLKELRILALRNNKLAIFSHRIEPLCFLKELHLQGNSLRFLPPELASFPELAGSDASVIKLDSNPWVWPIQEQLRVSIRAVFKYIGGRDYGIVYDRHHNRTKKE